MLFSISIIGCVNQNSQNNNSKENQTEKQKFIWDFNSKNIYTYSFEQRTNSIHDWGGNVEYIDTS